MFRSAALTSILVLAFAGRTVAYASGSDSGRTVADASGSECAGAAERAFEQAMGARDNPGLARKLFAESAGHYATLHANGASNVALYRNWGNAAFLAGRIGPAILAYRRGLQLDPGNAELLANLAFVRSQVIYPPGADSRPPPDDSPWSMLAPWLPWLARHARALLGLGTLLLYTLACWTGAHWVAVRRSRWPVRAVLLLILAGTCGVLWQHEEGRLQDEQAHPLVVIERDVGFFQGNGESYPRHDQLPLLHAGMEARRLLQRGGWLQIELPDGAIGWVPRRAALVDEPLP